MRGSLLRILESMPPTLALRDRSRTWQVEDLVAQIGDDFDAAWEVGEGLDENTPDGKEFFGAVDTLAEKCQ